MSELPEHWGLSFGPDDPSPFSLLHAMSVKYKITMCRWYITPIFHPHSTSTGCKHYIRINIVKTLETRLHQQQNPTKIMKLLVHGEFQCSRVSWSLFLLLHQWVQLFFCLIWLHFSKTLFSLANTRC